MGARTFGMVSSAKKTTSKSVSWTLKKDSKQGRMLLFMAPITLPHSYLSWPKVFSFVDLHNCDVITEAQVLDFGLGREWSQKLPAAIWRDWLY